MNAKTSARALVVVEGVHDISFLKTPSRILRSEDPSILDLAQKEAAGEIIFLPVGGSHSSNWSGRLEPLGLAEFHLYDRDVPPATEGRLAMAAAVNERPHCRAIVTSRRSLENYLHPQAIARAIGRTIAFGSHDDVAAIVARACRVSGRQKSWDQLSIHRRHKLRRHAKRTLNTVAAANMTAELFAEHDPGGEVASWLRCIGGIARGSRF